MQTKTMSTLEGNKETKRYIIQYYVTISSLMHAIQHYQTLKEFSHTVLSL